MLGFDSHALPPFSLAKTTRSLPQNDLFLSPKVHQKSPLAVRTRGPWREEGGSWRSAYLVKVQLSTSERFASEVSRCPVISPGPDLPQLFEPFVACA